MDKYLVINNPNGSGQGFNPAHADNPYHDLLEIHGFKYSHTTPVWRSIDGSWYAHHTYRFPGTDWVIAVDCHPYTYYTTGEDDYVYAVEAGRLGYARTTTLYGSRVTRYVRRKERELRKLLV